MVSGVFLFCIVLILFCWLDYAVGKQHDLVLQYFYHASCDSNAAIRFGAFVNDITLCEQGDEWRVMIEYLKRSVGAREGGNGNFAFEDFTFRGEDFQ